MSTRQESRATSPSTGDKRIPRLPEQAQSRFAPQTLFLDAIKERVPVFEGDFRLVREITLGTDKDLASAADKDGHFKVNGTLRYQACDDEKCFLPETIPLTWTLHFEPLDRARAAK